MKYAQESPSNDEKSTIDVIPISIETSELITVERMGYGVPVLLVVADIENTQCYFVCLNDYIDKILVPQHGNYTSTKTRTIYVPVTNNLSSEHGIRALRWYGKRAKLLAAFHTFAYQSHELQYLADFDQNDELVRMSRHFAERNMRYDFWGEMEICDVITMLGAQLRQYHTTGELNAYQKFSDDYDEGITAEEKQILEAFLRRNQVTDLWKFLANLPRIYEELWREWFLPTHLGELLSAPDSRHVDHNA